MLTDKAKLLELAERLTPAQRAWLNAMPATTEDVERTPCAEFWDNPDSLYVEVDGWDYWIGSKQMCSPEGASTFTSGSERLTLLGLELRALLSEASHAEG